MNDQIVIPTSKKKMILLVFGCLVFILGSLFMLYTAYKAKAYITPAIVLCSATVLFFGFGLVITIKRLINPKPALIINSKGIIDNSTATSVGFIPWKDITGFQPVTVASNNFLVVHVKNPNTYIDNANNVLIKQSLKYNTNNYGAPIAINASSLSKNIEEVEHLVLKTSKKYSM